MMSINGSGITTANPEEYGPPLPTANSTQELMRWCPSGVRQYLLNIQKNDVVADAPPVILAWMEERRMTRIPNTGPNRGKLTLSPDGARVWQALANRMAGKDNT